MGVLGHCANGKPRLRFEVTDLAPGVTVPIYPAAINNDGDIVGGVGEGGQMKPFIWRDGVFEILPFESSIALDINDFGDFIINGSSASYLVRAGVPIALQSIPDNPFNARSLNNHGVVVGSFMQSYLLSYAASWSNGIVQRISNDRAQIAHDINDAGIAVGTTSENDFSFIMAAMFRDGHTIPLGTLPGYYSSDAAAINSRGEIVGRAYSSEGVHTFVVRAGTMIDLGAPPGATTVYGNALNNLGHVVGYSWDGRRRERAFLYADGVMRDLNELVKPNTGWTFLIATGINDKGQIAAVGQINGGPPTAFLLTPKREPRDFHFKPPHGVFPGPCNTWPSP